MKYRIVEKFISINGEGLYSGELSTFIRFAGCNLNCIYCDTKWANEKNVCCDEMTKEEIYRFIKEGEINNVTLTGGEPLIQENIYELIQYLSDDKSLRIEIETNGSVKLDKIYSLNRDNVFVTMDYKLNSSLMEAKMELENFKYISKKDVLKFVVGSRFDLERAKEIINNYNILNKVNIFISPIFGTISYQEIIEFMKINKMNNTRFQLQIHKVIWPVDKRGV